MPGGMPTEAQLEVLKLSSKTIGPIENLGVLIWAHRISAMSVHPKALAESSNRATSIRILRWLVVSFTPLEVDLFSNPAQ